MEYTQLLKCLLRLVWCTFHVPSQRQCIFNGRNLLRYLLSLSLNLRVLSYIFYMVRKKFVDNDIFLLQQRSRSCNHCLSVNLVESFLQHLVFICLAQNFKNLQVVFKQSSSIYEHFLSIFLEYVSKSEPIECSVLFPFRESK